MGYLIVTKNPRNGKLIVITDGDERNDVSVFETEDDASRAAHDVPVCRAWPYQVVEVDL